MSKTLDAIRAKLQAMDNRKSFGNGNTDKTVYAHWNIPEGTSTTLRFLPDGNEDNTFFWVERQLIKLPFAGVKGQDERKQVFVHVPCIEMWDGKNTCPILNEVRPWWKDESLVDTARKYWIKKTYYMQGFVKQDPMNEDSPPENPIRKFIIGPQLFAIIKAALLDPDMTYSPVDYVNGTDFTVSKTSKGGYADYGTSKWARKESSLTEELQTAISTHGLVDLTTYLPKKPTPEQVTAMFEMFQASLDDELYDPDRWSQYYKPYGFEAGGDDADADGAKKASAPKATSVRPPVQTPAPAPTPAAKVDAPKAEPTKGEDAAPEPAAASTAQKSPQEILAMLRNRTK